MHSDSGKDRSKFWVIAGLLAMVLILALSFLLEKDFFNLHIKIKEKLSKQNIYFDDVQYSPFHPNAKIKKYKKNSLTRKPGNKLIENIKSNWDIDLKKSFMIGDKEIDKLSAYKSKLYFQYAQFDFLKQAKSIIKKFNS